MMRYFTAHFNSSLPDLTFFNFRFPTGVIVKWMGDPNTPPNSETVRWLRPAGWDKKLDCFKTGQYVAIYKRLKRFLKSIFASCAYRSFTLAVLNHAFMSFTIYGCITNSLSGLHNLFHTISCVWPILFTYNFHYPKNTAT